MGEVVDHPIGLIDLDVITLEGFSQSLPTITLSSSSIHILVTTFLLPSELNDTALHIRPCFPRMPLCYGCGSGNVCLKPFFSKKEELFPLQQWRNHESAQPIRLSTSLRCIISVHLSVNFCCRAKLAFLDVNKKGGWGRNPACTPLISLRGHCLFTATSTSIKSELLH